MSAYYGDNVLNMYLQNLRGQLSSPFHMCENSDLESLINLSKDMHLVLDKADIWNKSN